MKEKIKDVDAIPSKRIYLSIIADYQLKLALCELIDNAIDSWILGESKNKLTVTIALDYQRQIIEVVDNSGGIEEGEISLIVSPGQSRNHASSHTIGIFGVGSKRAVVALAEEIKILTRYKNERTLLVELSDNWVNDDNSWHLPVYKVDDIDESTTKTELMKLRSPIRQEEESVLIDHLGATYALFLENEDFEIVLNEKAIDAKTFDSWSYPPKYEPKYYNGELGFYDKGKVSVSILGGLTKSKDPAGGEYGAYFYCNNRLISRAYKGEEVGYAQARIGKPHPSVSIARVIVKMDGPAQLMPWNSSKSEINTKHPTFREVQEHIDRVLTHFSRLSRKWSSGGGWSENVFQYKVGEIVIDSLNDISSSTRLHLPPIPQSSKKKFSAVIKANNKILAKNKPWVRGAYEAIIAVRELPKLKLEQNNRLTLLILDSSMEIAFKDYLVNESGESYSENRLAGIMRDRTQVHNEIKKFVTLKIDAWKRIEYFYKHRCELVHKRGTVDISSNDLESFIETYEYTIKKLFKVNFSYES